MNGYEIDLNQEDSEKYYIYKYEKIKQIIVNEGNLVILGQTMMNIFTLNKIRNINNEYKGQYMIYPENDIKTIILDEYRNNEIIYKIRNAPPQVIIEKCVIKPPYLYLVTPTRSDRLNDYQQNVTLFGISTINGEKKECMQNFSIVISLEQDNAIYANGYTTDN